MSHSHSLLVSTGAEVYRLQLKALAQPVAANKSGEVRTLQYTLLDCLGLT